MLVYSKTTGFRHVGSIESGQVMLSEIADEYGFDVVFTETNEEFTIDGLSQYEIVFFLNTTGDILNDTEQESYEEWMTEHDGAFAGVHSAADTENGWAFYSEVVGQYHDGHEACCPEANIEWDPAALDHVTVRGLPSPWTRSEEWFYFDRAAEWSSKPGFQILGRVSLNRGTQPVSYLREWGNFRAFYTSLGQEGSTFMDADVKQHVAAGILWAVRREHLLGE
jgi:type 1 glutamine amidotransferase